MSTHPALGPGGFIDIEGIHLGNAFKLYHASAPQLVLQSVANHRVQKRATIPDTGEVGAPQSCVRLLDQIIDIVRAQGARIAPQPATDFRLPRQNVICDPLVSQPGQVLHDVLVSLGLPLTIADYYKRMDESHKQNPHR